MKKDIKFKNYFIETSNKVIDKLFKSEKELKKPINIDNDLNCYKNFIIHFFDKQKILTSSLSSYYELLPENILKNRDILFKALLDLNDDGYITIQKDLFKLMIIDNEKQWTDIPRKNTSKDDFKEIIESENKISKVKLTNEDITILEDRVFTMVMDEKNNVVPVKNITSAQVDAIDKMNVIQNIIIDVFINDLISKYKNKLSPKQAIILKELAGYNLWALKNKQDQFYSPDNDNEHTIFITKNIDKHIKTDVINAFVESSENINLNNNYFDRSMNDKIQKQVKLIFKEKGWKQVKEMMFNSYFTLFSFL